MYNYKNLSDYKKELESNKENVATKVDFAIKLAEKAPEILSQIIGKPCQAVNYQSAYGNYTITVREQNAGKLLAQYLELSSGVRIVAETRDRLDLKLVYNKLKSGVLGESGVQVQA